MGSLLLVICLLARCDRLLGICRPDLSVVVIVKWSAAVRCVCEEA